MSENKSENQSKQEENLEEELEPMEYNWRRADHVLLDEVEELENRLLALATSCYILKLMLTYQELALAHMGGMIEEENFIEEDFIEEDFNEEDLNEEDFMEGDFKKD